MLKIRGENLWQQFYHFRICFSTGKMSSFYLFICLGKACRKETEFAAIIKASHAPTELPLLFLLCKWAVKSLFLCSTSENWQTAKISVPFTVIMPYCGQSLRLLENMTTSPCSFCDFWPLLCFSFHFAFLPITTGNPTVWKIVPTGCRLLQYVLTRQEIYIINVFMHTGGADCKKFKSLTFLLCNLMQEARAIFT